MKLLRKFTALLLALCILFSLSLSAFAAEESTSGYLAWELDESGTLHISGRGKLVPFTSADDQPWASLREEIVAVELDPGAYMIIPDAAYWFSGCVNLEFCELPSFTDLGTDTFKDCGKLEILKLYYHDETFRIADSAFSGVNTSDLTIITEDTVTQAALEMRGLSVISAYAFLAGGTCGISGCTCSSCSWSYSYAPKDASTHYIWEVCNNCSANEYAYRHTGSHSFNSSGVCTLCGYAQAQSCSHSSTQRIWSGCDWEDVCRNCGETVNWGTTHGGYTYGSWTYYTASQHRRYGTCNDCGGGGKYQYGSHSTTAQYSQYNDTHHHVTQYCSVCASSVGSATTQAHSLSYGSWSKASTTQHSRAKSCSVCGYSGTEYGDHSYSYGSWSSCSDTQHRRTKSCSVCGDSAYEYGNHADTNADGKCDTCGYAMSVTVTWDAGTNGGKVNGAVSVTTSVPLNTTAAAPSYTPAKTGHTFTNWYTAATGGSLHSTVTITAARTFYAQFTANTYTITWDLRDGRTETTKQEYGKALILPSEEPTRDTAYFDGWYTETTGGTKVDGSTMYDGTSDTTYYAHWIEVFSVTIPTVLPLRVDESGEVYATEASISNHSSGIVKISSVTLTGQNGWSIVPYSTNMASEKVDAKLVGLSLNQVETTASGPSETLTLGEGWRILREDTLALSYDAVVSALSQPVTDEAILSAVFVVEWA